MKKFLWLPIVLALFTPLSVRADQKEDAAGIQKLLDEFTVAWNKNDAKAMSAIWTADGDLITPFGRHAHGRAEIEKLFADEHAGKMAGTTYSGAITGIHHLCKNYAVVDFDGMVNGMKNADGTAAPPFKHHVTWIAEKKDGKWLERITRAFAYVIPPAEPAPAK